MRPVVFGLAFLMAASLSCAKTSTSAEVIAQQSADTTSSIQPINWFNKDGSLNWEAERQQRGIKVDTIVVHHTAAATGITWQQLSRAGYDRVYAPRFQSNDPDPYVKGQKPSSGHWRKDKDKMVEVFYVYHRLIRANGKIEDLLPLEQVGWHNGDWAMNCRSVAIVLDGDLSTTTPPDAMLRACAKTIVDAETHIGRPLTIIGHQDVKATECPGSWWHAGGKERLTALAAKERARRAK